MAPLPPMTVCEKILFSHSIGLDSPTFVPGQVLCLAPDWMLASEASWSHMDKIYTRYGRPGLRRKDRFWLAPDHLVDPRVNHLPKPKAMIEACERIAEELEMGDNFNPPNTTIVHTEFYRSRSQPGMLIFGSDSHTGSSGCVGSLAIGMGVTDVFIQLITGETYLKLPEIVQIELVGKPRFGITGKDVILGVLGLIKRNTACYGRLVEFTGQGLLHLSCDARFAMANMVTELGGIGACVVPDAITKAYIEARKDPRHKNDAIYYTPDEGAQYADSYTIDISEVETLIALYPSPDNVFPIAKVEPFALDGVFIGACTTTEEELILAALVLEQGLKQGLRPVDESKKLRRVTPGSLAILQRLKKLGLTDVYEEAGFVVGAPGCSYCVGLGADQAGKGEVWLSSQNRNFRDRMGPGSIANITSAAAVAASSFSMIVTNPQFLLSKIDKARYASMRAYPTTNPADLPAPAFSQPEPLVEEDGMQLDAITTSFTTKPTAAIPRRITSRVQRFGDNIDTDAIIPADHCFPTDPAELGKGCFVYYKPSFYDLVHSGASVIVAGEAFGSGSSREQAPRSIKAAGVQAIIARSFAFIYGRNQANCGILGICMNDDAFYEAAREGADIEIELEARIIRCNGVSFSFFLDPVEEQLLAAGGLLSVYEQYGPRLFRELQQRAFKAEQYQGKVNVDALSHPSTNAVEW